MSFQSSAAGLVHHADIRYKEALLRMDHTDGWVIVIIYDHSPKEPGVVGDDKGCGCSGVGVFTTVFLGQE